MHFEYKAQKRGTLWKEAEKEREYDRQKGRLLLC